jgi:hypothetical protein
MGRLSQFTGSTQGVYRQYTRFPCLYSAWQVPVQSLYTSNLTQITNRLTMAKSLPNPSTANFKASRRTGPSGSRSPRRIKLATGPARRYAM